MITSEQAQKLLKGNQTFSMLGFSMLLTRLKGNYLLRENEENLQACTDEINVFLGKFHRVMGNDYATIMKL